jgi:hypothetical protein
VHAAPFALLVRQRGKVGVGISTLQVCQIEGGCGWNGCIRAARGCNGDRRQSRRCLMLPLLLLTLLHGSLHLFERHLIPHSPALRFIHPARRSLRLECLDRMCMGGSHTGTTQGEEQRGVATTGR